MKKKKTPKKNYAFVDNANVTVSVARQGRHIDRGKLKGWLERRWNVEKVFMLMGYHPDYEPMYEYFRSLGYELVFKPMNIGENVELKGNIDTDLVLRVMKERMNYDKAILLTGDGDFLSLVNHLKDKNKLGQIIVPHSGRYSHFLEEAAGEYITSLTGKKRWLAYVKGQSKSTGGKKKSEQRDQEKSDLKKKDDIQNASIQKNKHTQPNKSSVTNAHQPKKNTVVNQSKSPKQNDAQAVEHEKKHATQKTIGTPGRNKRRKKKVPSNTQQIANPSEKDKKSLHTIQSKKSLKSNETKPLPTSNINFPKHSGETPGEDSPTTTFSPKDHKKIKHKKKAKVDPSHHTRFFD